MKSGSEPILFERDDEEQSSARIIDFNAYRMGSVRRVLSHEIIFDDDFEDADEFDFFLLAASSRWTR